MNTTNHLTSPMMAYGGLVVLLLCIGLWSTSTALPMMAQAIASGSPSPILTATPGEQWAIASEFGANLLECTRADCKAIATLVNQTPFELLNRDNGWLHIRIPGGLEGYIPDFLALPLPTQTPNPTFVPTRDGCSQSMPSNWVTYTVSLGDTLSGIAQRARTTVDVLMEVNCLANRNLISIGQQLFVPIRIRPPQPTAIITGITATQPSPINTITVPDLYPPTQTIVVPSTIIPIISVGPTLQT